MQTVAQGAGCEPVAAGGEGGGRGPAGQDCGPVPSSSSAARGSLLVLAGAVLWGTTGTSQALGPDAATPLAIGATRLVAGGVLLVAWAMAAGRRPRRQVGVVAADRALVAHVGGGAAEPEPLPQVGRVHGRVLAGLAGALGVAAYQVSFFAAVDVAGVALGTAVAIGSSPVFTGLIEWGTGGARPAARWWAATAVGAAGVAVLAGPSALVLSGVLLALAAGASYATYAVAAKRLLDSGMTSPSAMALVFGGGGVLLLPVLPAVELGWLATGRGAGMLAWLAVATILLAYLLFGAGLRAVPAATAATLSLAEPLTAALLGVVVLGERLSPSALVGAGLVLAGLLVVALPARQAVPAPG